MQDQTPHRIVTREKQQSAELKRTFDEAERQQEERSDPIRGKRARLLGMGVALDDDLPPLPKHTFHATQREADALVAETANDERFRPLPDLPPANNAVRMIVGCWYASGTLALPRGWVRAVMVACRAAGAPHPNQKCLRWYRSKVQDSPAYFAGMRGVPRELLLQLEQDVEV